MALDSRLRQPGWGKKAVSRERTDSSLPPILDCGRGAVATESQPPKPTRSASLGSRGSYAEAAAARQRSNSRCSDHSLPPLQRNSSGSYRQPEEPRPVSTGRRPSSAGRRPSQSGQNVRDDKSSRMPPKRQEESPTPTKPRKPVARSNSQTRPSDRPEWNDGIDVSREPEALGSPPERDRRSDARPPPAGGRSSNRSLSRNQPRAPPSPRSAEVAAANQTEPPQQQARNRSTSRKPVASRNVEKDAADKAPPSNAPRNNQKPPRPQQSKPSESSQEIPKSPPLRASGGYALPASDVPKQAAPKSPPLRAAGAYAAPKSPPLKAAGAYAMPSGSGGYCPPKSPPIKASGGYSMPGSDTGAPGVPLAPKSPPLRAAGSYAMDMGGPEQPLSQQVSQPKPKQSRKPPASSVQHQDPPPGPPAAPLKAEAGIYDMALPDENIEVDEGERIPCEHCGRKFIASAYERHVNLCQKVFMKKRKAFDTVQQRLAEGAKAPPPEPPKQQNEEQDTKKKAAWKIRSEAFRAAMKDARIVQQYQKEGKSLKDLPPPKATDPELDDRTPCPHCGRKFGEVQAARHIPLCKEKSMKLGGGGRGKASAPGPKRRP